MRKLLSSPADMPLSDAENQTYQNALKYAADISLNLMAVKVEKRPAQFVDWCNELIRLCRHGVNMALLEPCQMRPLQKLQETLETGVAIGQLKMARIAPWPIIVGFLEQQGSAHALQERLRLLNYLEGLRHCSLAAMSTADRLAFAGKHTALHDPLCYNFDVEWFASTKGARTFHQLLQQCPEAFDEALSQIPLEGEVSKADYLGFVVAYQGIFSRCADVEQAPLAAATRLLAMRRPDQFIALTNAKIAVLCQGMGIAKFGVRDFEAYWQDMIGTLRSFAWWRHKAPENEAELRLWRIRALLMDLFLFADESLADSSNFVRLRDKAPTGTKGSHSKRGPKASIETLVDRALAAEEIPDYLKTKRQSIINEVQNGKSVEQVLGLMRTIFG